MPGKTRGRERLVNCDSCGRRMPRDKCCTYNRIAVYSTDLKTADDVRLTSHHENHYCPSCAKSKGIYEKKKRQAERKSERERAGGFSHASHERHGSQGGYGTQGGSSTPRASKNREGRSGEFRW